LTLQLITCNFIGDFKVGDNILLNGNALCRLSATNENDTFNKLMVVQASSIVEAALDQIIYRGTKIERFNNIIQAMKPYKLLDGLGQSIYNDLHRLHKLRNRVHIQFDDEPEGVGRDEHLAFSAKEVSWSLSLCVRVLKHLAKRYPRPEALAVFAHNVAIPTVTATPKPAK
jgi:hypothetical protein